MDELLNVFKKSSFQFDKLVKSEHISSDGKIFTTRMIAEYNNVQLKIEFKSPTEVVNEVYNYKEYIEDQLKEELKLKFMELIQNGDLELKVIEHKPFNPADMVAEFDRAMFKSTRKPKNHNKKNWKFGL